MNQKALFNDNYTYDADGERIVRYVPGRLDAFYSANQAGHNDRLERFIYPSGLLTVKTLPEANQRTKQIATYTKHYYVGAERVTSVIGSVNSIGYRVCNTDFPTQTEIGEMTQKVGQAGQALQEDYTYFEKQLNLSQTFEKHPECGGGPTEAETPYWFHPDHLGSSSYISNKHGEISQHLEYFPFGETLVEEHKNSNNSPYKFNAKELDNETGNYYYGARYLNPKFSIWLSVDPLAEERLGVSPYNYVQNNPLKRVDSDGRLDNPIYDEKTGDLLGTDDKGIQGTAIVMNKDDFTQGMSHEDALKKDLGVGNMSSKAMANLTESFVNLPSRPDWDGYLTLEEVNEWYRTGKGKPLFADLSKIDLSGIYSLGEKYVGQVKTFNLLLNSGSLNDGLVYGNITLKRYPNHQVRAFADRYDFEMHNPRNPLNWGRNAETVIGRKVAGEGTPFEINIHGSATLKPLFPWTK